MNYQAYIGELKKVCEETAVFIRDNFRRVRSDQIELKSANSMVSYVDKNAEQMITRRLKEIMPEAGFITEESMVENSYAEYTWIVDPLDGTTNFLKGIPHFSVSIALQKADSIVLGMVYDIMQEDIYYATEGHGAFLNEQKLLVNSAVPVQDMLIATGFPYDKSSITLGFDTALNYFVHNSRCIRRLGSAALDLCYIASGVFDLYFEMHLSRWDYAAGALIVKEAGGLVCDLNGSSDFRSGNILATNPENREVIDFLHKTFR